MCKRNDFYFRNVLWNLHIIAQLRAQNLRDVPTFQPDSLAFVKKWKLLLSTVPKNYIWNQLHWLCKVLKICTSSSGVIYHQRELIVFSRKQCWCAQSEGSSWKDIQSWSSEIVLQPGVGMQSKGTQYCNQSQNPWKGQLWINSAWLSRWSSPSTHPLWPEGLLLSTHPPIPLLCALNKPTGPASMP